MLFRSNVLFSEFLVYDPENPRWEGRDRFFLDPVVPFVAVGCGDVKLREGGCLADIAPTMLPYIGLPVPSEMTGKSLIVD